MGRPSLKKPLAGWCLVSSCHEKGNELRTNYALAALSTLNQLSLVLRIQLLKSSKMLQLQRSIGCLHRDSTSGCSSSSSAAAVELAGALLGAWSWPKALKKNKKIFKTYVFCSANLSCCSHKPRPELVRPDFMQRPAFYKEESRELSETILVQGQQLRL